MPLPLRRPALALLLALPAAVALAGWREPPAAMTQALPVAATPRALPSPDGHRVLLLERPALPPQADLPARRHDLAGLSLDLAHRVPADLPAYHGGSLFDAAEDTGAALRGLPPAARILHAHWAPDSRRLALAVREAGGLTLWLAEADGRLRRLARQPLNAVFGAPCAWLDARSLACRFAAAGLPAAPPAVPAPREADGRPSVVRPQRGLLHDAADTALFVAAAASRLVHVALDGRQRPLGVQGAIVGHAPSPDGRFLLVQRLTAPHPLGYPWEQFARRVELLEVATSRLRLVSALPFEPDLGPEQDAVSAHARGHAWRADAPASLFWAEALDGGDARREVPLRDRALLWTAPFTTPPHVLGEFPQRLEAIYWGRGDLALAQTSWWATRRAALWRLRPDAAANALADPAAEILAWNSEDHAADPGRPLQRAGTAPDSDWLAFDGEAPLFAATDDGAGGERPELRALGFDAAGRAAWRTQWRSRADMHEAPVARLAEGRLLLRRESPRLQPHWRVLDPAAGTERALGVPPAPTFANTRELAYRRGDGLPLKATLHLPAGGGGEPPPLVLLAYPEDYLSAGAAAQAPADALRWHASFLGGPAVWTALGYAVLMGGMPVVARPLEAPNDTYVEQLVDNAHSALDEVARLGLADTKRVAVAGHSYGAAMVATLLANSHRFCAGIAMSGAYNRTLTPFGFQTEMRNLWQTPRAYLAMSPLLEADRIEAPLLLIHGEADDNPGTAPAQSEALFAALQGLGRRARLVMLPGEGHAYRSREAVLHTLAEQAEWLERWVAGGAGCATERNGK